jgi:hypothetical protein
MKPGARPIRTTLMIGGLGALAWMLAAPALGWYGYHPLLRFGVLWLLTGLYALLLVRWSRRGLAGVIFPLVVLGLWGGLRPQAPGTVVMALAVLSWVRSGICFPVPPGRAALREVLVCGGGGLLVAVLAPNNTLSWALGIWLFFLVQALFFVVFETGGRAPDTRAAEDPFERARRLAEEILAGD